MKATLKSIAQAAGVSVATVSLVLNGKPCRVSQPTKERIIRTARDMHYAPNQAARSLKTQKSHTFGFLVPDISNAFYSDLAKLVEEYSYQSGYRLMLGNSNGLYKRDYEYLKLFIERNVDAVITIPSSTFVDGQAGKFFSLIRENKVPVIVIDHFMHSDAVYNINIDHVRGGYLAARHLLSLGHRRIGLCTGPLELAIGRQRLQGYRQALEEFQCPFEEDLVYQDAFDIASGGHSVDYFLARQVTGICCSNDMMALGVYRKCAHYGLRIPENISVVGFDNIILSEILNPPLTTAALPIDQLARTAVEVAIRLSRGESSPEGGGLLFQPEMVIRDSTRFRGAPPPGYNRKESETP